MGCGASTFNRDESGGMGGITSLCVNPLHRDSPWRRKGDRPTIDSNPSSKKLLVPASVEEEGSDPVGHKSVLLHLVFPKDEGGFMKEPPVQTMKETVPCPKEVNDERPVSVDHDHDDKDDDRRVVVEEDKGPTDRASEEQVLFFPRSPSFRYYCMPRDDDSSSSSSSDELSTHIDEGRSEGILTCADSNKSLKEQDDVGDKAPAELLRSETSSLSKKSRKSAGRRLCVVLPKGKPTKGKKNLWNVSSCSPRRAAAQAAS